MQAQTKRERFEQIAVPHLDAAFNLARWLAGNEQDAQDIVQEAYLRAFRFFDSYRGDNGHAWLLTIVRNTAYTWLRQNRMHEAASLDADDVEDADASNIEISLMQAADIQLLRQAIADLPLEFREVIILHEMEGLAYKEIAAVVNIPVGTVMSRLSRARDRLQKAMMSQDGKER